ncbi:MAG: hypothetical protein U0935_06550 [Pirellulales bacterium]
MASGNTPDFSDFDPVASDPFANAVVTPATPDPQGLAPTTPAAAPASGAGQAAPAKPKPPKPPFSVYTFMLMVCVVFLMVGCALLISELSRYNFEIQPGKRLF